MEQPYSAHPSAGQPSLEEPKQPVASTSASAHSEPATPRLESLKRPSDDRDGLSASQSTSAIDPCSATDGQSASLSETGAVSAVRPVSLSLSTSGRGQLARRRADRSQRTFQAPSNDDRAQMSRSRSEGSLAEAVNEPQEDLVQGQDSKRRKIDELHSADRAVGVPQAGFGAGRAVIAPPTLILSQSSSLLVSMPPSVQSLATPAPSDRLESPASSIHSSSVLRSPRVPVTAQATAHSLGKIATRQRSASLPPLSRQPFHVSHPPLQSLFCGAAHRPGPIPPHRPRKSGSAEDNNISSSSKSPSRRVQDLSDTYADPRAVVSRIERQGGSWPLSQGDLLAYHAARLLDRGGEKISLSPLSLVPPISKATLRELDLGEILRNPQLRHDSVFDPNLMFRPNYDGERGDRKRELAAQYWSAVEREIDTGCRCTTFHSSALLPCLCLSPTVGHSTPLFARLPSRIPPLIHGLKSILLSLLPNDASGTSSVAAVSHTQIVEVLDAGFLAQQIERGILDIGALARDFLGPTIKLHCAPMRDSLVDEMVEACGREGAEVVRGLMMAFEILELMKLDIANHQLRSLRPYLVDTAMDFEVRFFLDAAARRHALGIKAFPRTLEWLRQSSKAHSSGSITEVVSSGALDLIFRVDTASPLATPVTLLVPETFQFDAHRISSFHADTVDLTVIYLLLSLFGQISHPARPTESQIDELRQELWSLLSEANSAAASERGSGKALALGISKMKDPVWQEAVKALGLQIAARASQIKNGALVPSPSILSLVDAYLTAHLRTSSSIFQLLQSRLKSTIGLVVEELITGDRQRWSPSDSLQLLSTTTTHRGQFDGCTTRCAALVPTAKLMASDAKRGTKRGHEHDDMVGDEKRARLGKVEAEHSPAATALAPSAIDLSLTRNGLNPLSTEVKLLGDRIARVVAFHLSVHHDYYATLRLSSLA